MSKVARGACISIAASRTQQSGIASEVVALNLASRSGSSSSRGNIVMPKALQARRTTSSRPRRTAPTADSARVTDGETRCCLTDRRITPRALSWCSSEGFIVATRTLASTISQDGFTACSPSRGVVRPNSRVGSSRRGRPTLEVPPLSREPVPRDSRPSAGHLGRRAAEGAGPETPPATGSRRDRSRPRRHRSR